MIEQSVTIDLAESEAGTHRITVASQQACNAIVVGQCGAGKSTSLDLWAWRFIRAGAQVLIIGAERNAHAELKPILHRNSTSCELASVDESNPNIAADLTIVECRRRSATPVTDALRHTHRIGVLLAQ